MIETEDQSSIVEVSRVIQGLFHWGGQAITVDSVVVTQDSITEIIREQGFKGTNSKEQTEGIGARTMMTKRKSTRMPATND